MENLSGKRLDARYELQEIIGIGGMAVVYKAFDTISERVVAVKILKDEFTQNHEFIRRFKNESKAISMLNHKNIVKIADVSFGDRLSYIVMEYIDGISLKEYLDQQGIIKWHEATYFTVQILKALEHAHEHKIIHRDIKSQNIMLLEDGTIKVTDFGIARFMSYNTKTVAGKAIGSVHYIAPEQARGAETDERTDIYSCGIVLYEMVTGKVPFDGDDAVSIAIKQIGQKWESPTSLNPSLPRGLEQIIEKAIQKEPRARFNTARQMLVELEKFRKDPSIIFNYKLDDSASPSTEGFVDIATSADLENKISAKSSNENVDSSAVPLKRINIPENELHPNISVNHEQTPQNHQDYEESVYINEETKDENKVIPNWLIGLIIAGGVVAIGIAVLLILLFSGAFGNNPNPDTSSSDVSSENSSETSEVELISLPNFVGSTLEEILDSPLYAGYNFSIEYIKEEGVQDGVVARQSPEFDTALERLINKNDPITLYVNGEATITLPANLLGQSIDEVTKTLDRMGLKVISSEVSSPEAKGVVLRMEPGAGATVKTGDTITLTISSGSEEFSLPSVVGQTYSSAKSSLEALGLVVTLETKDDTNLPQYQVISTSPRPGSSMKKGDRVTVVYSSGKFSQKTLRVNVDLPNYVASSVGVSVYLDGSLYTGPITLNPSRTPTYSFDVTSTNGTKTLKITLDGQNYRVYSLNFDQGTITETSRSNYVYTVVGSSPDNNSNPEHWSINTSETSSGNDMYTGILPGA